MQKLDPVDAGDGEDEAVGEGHSEALAAEVEAEGGGAEPTFVGGVEPLEEASVPIT